MASDRLIDAEAAARAWMRDQERRLWTADALMAEVMERGRAIKAPVARWATTPVWREAVESVLTQCMEEDVNPFGFIRRQFAHPDIADLPKNGKPLQPGILTTERAWARYRDGVKRSATVTPGFRLPALCAQEVSFAESYVVRPDVPTWEAAEDDEAPRRTGVWTPDAAAAYPHIRILGLAAGARRLCERERRLPLLPTLPAPDEGWTYPEQRWRLRRLIATKGQR